MHRCTYCKNKRLRENRGRKKVNLPFDWIEIWPRELVAGDGRGEGDGGRRRGKLERRPGTRVRRGETAARASEGVEAAGGAADGGEVAGARTPPRRSGEAATEVRRRRGAAAPAREGARAGTEGGGESCDAMNRCMYCKNKRLRENRGRQKVNLPFDWIEIWPRELVAGDGRGEGDGGRRRGKLERRPGTRVRRGETAARASEGVEAAGGAADGGEVAGARTPARRSGEAATEARRRRGAAAPAREGARAGTEGGGEKNKQLGPGRHSKSRKKNVQRAARPDRAPVAVESSGSGRGREMAAQ
nr:serine/arginine repetitive matrix protein 2-like [Aegilops tauschii subsp. strangulata]